METFIGRKLRRNEVVHHKDENRQHNVLSNLELMTRSAHTSHHKPWLGNGQVGVGEKSAALRLD